MPCKMLLCIFFILTSLYVSQATLGPQDEAFYGKEADRFDWSKHPCNRPCDDDGVALTCHYLFVVETYLSMSKACYDCPRNITDCFRPHCLPADGQNKFLYVVNRNLPGPYIQVCLDDTIVVDLRNTMDADSTTIHWHGIDQSDTPYMDGVPFVTQCPILPGNTFRYEFKADQLGTYFWHSHIGAQRSDGMFGPLTIRPQPKFNPHLNLYDFDEHSILIADWKQLNGEDFYMRHIHNTFPPGNSTILINGHSSRQKNFAASNEEPLYVPSSVFTVKKGFRYRFRLVNAGSAACPIQMSIDNHTLTVISTDSNDIVPIEVDSIYSWPGERYDFIVNADKEINNYWIRYRAIAFCGTSFGVAILRYESAPLKDPVSPVGWEVMPNSENFRELNPFNLSAKAAISLDSLKSVTANDITLGEKVDQQIYISFDYNSVDNYQFHRAGLYGINQISGLHPEKVSGTLQFNHITFKMPSIPILSQREMNRPEMFCNSSTLADKNCTKEFCICTQMIQVKLNNVVELVLVDEGQHLTLHHPMHLHGQFFRVVAVKKLDGPVTVDQIKQLDREGKIKRSLDRAPLKDTARVPNGGYTIVRFLANNPGYWFFHCHFEEHTDLGMALVFKVGEDEDMVPVPTNFPQCGNFTNKVVDQKKEDRMSASKQKNC